MKYIKNAYAEYVNAEMAYDEIDELLESDPENEDLEAAWDEAYRASFEAGEKLAESIGEFSMGAIDLSTARRMLVVKGDELGDLIRRAA